MSSTLMPFLYQTRTLQRAFRIPVAFSAVRLAHSAPRRKTQRQDNSIPFEWDPDSQNEGLDNVPGQQSTITPSEAEVFKGIFDEIAQGKMPTAKKRSAPSDLGAQMNESSQDRDMGLAARDIHGFMPRSIVEQARVTDFREKFLRRYPQSLRNAAQVALGLYELEPSSSGTSQMLELDEADVKKWEERARYDQARDEERKRVDAKMKACTTDAALWKVMEEEVFSLPEKLGIMQDSQGKSLTKKGKAKGKATSKGAQTVESTISVSEEAKRVMDVHGPLYSHFISTGLSLFDSAFASSSPYIFQILPRIKDLGLPSYVLGVSTPFYSRLARIHWTRFGDASSALDVLQEMNASGLYADEEVHDLLVTIRDHLHGCTWGAQGPFVMAMMENPPYDSALTQRLEEVERFTRHSLSEQSRDYAN